MLLHCTQRPQLQGLTLCRHHAIIDSFIVNCEYNSKYFQLQQDESVTLRSTRKVASCIWHTPEHRMIGSYPNPTQTTMRAEILTSDSLPRSNVTAICSSLYVVTLALCLLKSAPPRFLVKRSARFSQPEIHSILSMPCSLSSRRKLSFTCLIRPPQLQLLAV